MEQPLTHSIVRVQSGGNTGSGFLIEGGYILTAAHNLQNGATHQFSICGQDNIFDIPVKAELVKQFSKKEGGIALFKLICPLDVPYCEKRLLPLGNEKGCLNTAFQTFGFPTGKSENGVPYNSSRIDGLGSAHGKGFPQMTLSEPGNISAGYSGGLIYIDGKGVVGMILEKGYELAVGVPVSFIKKKISPHISPQLPEAAPGHLQAKEKTG